MTCFCCPDLILSRDEDMSSTRLISTCSASDQTCNRNKTGLQSVSRLVQTESGIFYGRKKRVRAVTLFGSCGVSVLFCSSLLERGCLTLFPPIGDQVDPLINENPPLIHYCKFTSVAFCHLPICQAQ